MTETLLAFDTDRIKNYVFATAKLKEIRGASAILDELNRQTMPKLVGGEMIYANGGGGLFVVASAEQAKNARASIEQAYRKKFISITSTVIENYDKNKFQAQFRLLGYCLRLAKDQTKGEQLLLTHPFFHFCESCGTEYAQENSNENELICAKCESKRDQDERIKESLSNYSSQVNQGELFEAHDGLWPCLLTQLKAKGYPINDYNRPDEFNTLADLSSPKGYMALIYADGDGMGKLLDGITSSEQMHDFAHAVDNSMYQATVEAINQHLRPEGKDKIWPFDVLMLGGDDLIMVTRAESAVAVGKTVMEKFTEFTQPYSEKYQCGSLRVSVSVVIAHANYPFGALQKLAESGLKFAKKEGAKRDKKEGLLNFLVVNSANHLDFGEYYKQTLTQKEGHESMLYRSQRPYTATNLEILLNQIEQVRDVPRSKLEQLRQAVFKSKNQASLDAMMALLRLRDKEQRKALLKLFGTEVEQQLHIPWLPKKDSHDFITPIVDIAELIDFVARKHA